MKFLYLSVLLFTFNLIQAQIINIPDPNFKNALVNYDCVDLDGDDFGDADADTNNDGEIQLSEALAVYRLEVNFQGIESLVGLEAFVNLEMFSVLNNNITSLDMTNQPDLTKLLCWENQISNLNISENTELEFLWCASNSALEELDLSPFPNLQYLLCGVNGLNELDLSQNPNLIYLSCFLNNLENLDVSELPNLEVLYCQKNDLSSLDVSNNPLLTDIDCRSNSLSNLDFTVNSDLIRILASDNVLTYFNIQNGNNPTLDSVHVFDNPGLLCIRVDDENATYPSCNTSNFTGWCKDETATYDEDCILGVSDNPISEIRLFPNPVEEILNVDHKSFIESLKIYSIGGALLLDTEFSTIDVSSLPSGLYLAEISSGEGIVTKKFIKK